MRFLSLLIVFVVTLFGANLISPTHSYKLSNGLATDIIYAKQKLYIASDSGVVDIYDTQTKQLSKTLHLSKIKDFMGDAIDSKIFALDILQGKLLILSQDNGGYSRITLYDGEELKEVVSSRDKFNIIKAKFIDTKSVVLALISNDIISYNITTKKQNWTTQASASKFSSLAIDSSRNQVVIADESGDVHLISLKDGTHLKTLSGQNVDNLFSIDFKNGIVLTGGQDRRAGVYNLHTSVGYYQNAKFFIYGVGLSPSGKIGAYSYDMDNNVVLFDTASRVVLGRCKATKMVVNSIYFINEKEFFINTAARDVGYYKIK